jgi:hypothetical protein
MRTIITTPKVVNTDCVYSSGLAFLSKKNPIRLGIATMNKNPIIWSIELTRSIIINKEKLSYISVKADLAESI